MNSGNCFSYKRQTTVQSSTKTAVPNSFSNFFWAPGNFLAQFFHEGEVVGMDIEMIQVHYIYYAAADLTRGLA